MRDIGKEYEFCLGGIFHIFGKCNQLIALFGKHFFLPIDFIVGLFQLTVYPVFMSIRSEKQHQE